jgi:hypothetical protein
VGVEADNASSGREKLGFRLVVLAERNAETSRMKRFSNPDSYQQKPAKRPFGPVSNTACNQSPKSLHRWKLYSCIQQELRGNSQVSQEPAAPCRNTTCQTPNHVRSRRHSSNKWVHPELGPQQLQHGPGEIWRWRKDNHSAANQQGGWKPP